VAKKTDEVAPIIIKRVKKYAAGHHGGAWKVAYADFVTAMMAFFLLLWLLNVTTKEQKDAISNYFDPSHPKVSQSQSGAGGVMGGLSISKEGAMTQNQQDMNQSQSTGKPNQTTPEDQNSTQQMEAELRAHEDARFEATKKALEDAVKQEAELKDLARHLMIDITPEGLRIQIIDQNGDPMFPSGSAQMYDKTKVLMSKVAELIKKLPNDISVRGHTDAHPYASGADYTNWELSSDRANASRRILEDHDIPEKRLANVMGKAETDPLLPKDPLDARNRRITIMLLREKLVDAVKRGEFGPNVKMPPPPQPQTYSPPAQQPIQVPAYQKTQGAVQFP
jgi:chemotaxis protein MotB